MKRILIFVLLLTLIGCSRTPKIMETSENALLHISEEDHVQFSVHNDGIIHTLTTEETIELINILNETSYTVEESEGDLLSDLSYVRLKINGDQHTFFGNYYIAKQSDTDIFKQINNSELYNFFISKIDLTLNEKDQELLENKKVPDKNNDPGWSKIVGPFIEYYNQIDPSRLYPELDPSILERRPIDSLEVFTKRYTSDNVIRVSEYLGNYHYIEYDYYHYDDREGCTITPYINQKYFLEQTKLLDQDSELANQLSQVLSIQPMIHYYNIGIISGITFADNKDEEVSEIYSGPQLSEDVYFKIDTFRD
ncbi:MAG: hypothetical protein IKL88_06080, partial [Erysipelotrichales bacterium]|nr:hypothetical protein [Erysipelotrichales bacterium]